jgi:hypothetical protein
MTGHSLAPLLANEAGTVYADNEPVGYELGGNAALFRGDYKIMKNRGPIGDGEWHLYNLADDPGESKDLKDREVAVFRSMLQAYDRYVEDFGVLPVPVDYDQRRQVVVYGIKNRLSDVIPFAVVLLILIISAVFYWRFTRAGKLRK